MQKIRINNKFFRSLTKASEFLHLDKQFLSTKMKNKKAITYKDLLIEKVDVEKPIRKPEHTRKGIPVLVDGIAYKNCSEAERALGLCKCSVSDALRRGSKKLLGHTIEAVYPSMINSRHKSKVRVYNKTENKYFDSIREAASYANVDEWTMSKKMEFAGSFIDFNGNEYIRLEPMKTINVYKNTGKKLEIKKQPYTRTPNMKGCVSLNEISFDEINPIEPPKKEKIPQIVKDAINEKIINILKEKGLYEDIVNLLNYGGFSSIKVIKD